MKNFTGRCEDDIFPKKSKLSKRILSEVETHGNKASMECPDTTSLLGDNIGWELNLCNLCKKTDGLSDQDIICTIGGFEIEARELIEMERTSGLHFLQQFPLYLRGR